MENPIQLLSEESDHLDTHTGQSVTLYIRMDTSESVLDEDKTVVNTLEYYINDTSFNVDMIRTVTVIDGDTAQIIEHSFDLYEYLADTIDLINQFQIDYGEYPTVSAEDVYNDLSKSEIQVNEKLDKTTFLSLEGEEVDISQGTCVLMFSFIGCGGCEYAMKEMSKRDFEFRDDIEVYYASHVDKESVLRSYLDKKGFPGQAFGKESLINEEFGAWTFPTFFVISPEGHIERVFHGYSKELEALLF